MIKNGIYSAVSLPVAAAGRNALEEQKVGQVLNGIAYSYVVESGLLSVWVFWKHLTACSQVSMWHIH